MLARYFGSMIGFVALSVLPGCIGLAVAGGEMVVDKATIAREQAAANAGNIPAQYEVGDAYCCSARGQKGLFKDNQAATVWFCRAARQDYGPAKLRLARVYSGDRITGLALMERVAGTIDAPPAVKPVALMWAKLASADSDADIAADGTKLAGSLEASMSPDERQRAADLSQPDWRRAPCEWREVFPSA